MLVDTHCHLDQFDDAEAVIKAASERGITRLVVVSEDPESMLRVLELKQQHPTTVLAGLGLHPVWVVRNPDMVQGALEQLEEILPQADELGEVGLDYKWATERVDQLLQEEVLAHQLNLAARCAKPVNLHARRCLRQTMERAIAFRRNTGLNAHMHWFTQSRKLVRICNDEGIYVSVGPTVLNDEQTQRVALEISDELLLLETDAPVAIGGRPGHPLRVREVAECMARLRGHEVEEMAALCAQNFARFIAPCST